MYEVTTELRKLQTETNWFQDEVGKDEPDKEGLRSHHDSIEDCFDALRNLLDNFSHINSYQKLRELADTLENIEKILGEERAAIVQSDILYLSYAGLDPKTFQDVVEAIADQREVITSICGNDFFQVRQRVKRAGMYSFDRGEISSQRSKRYS